MKEIKVGEKYYVKEFPNAGFADLHEVRVVFIKTQEKDGRKVVRYRRGTYLANIDTDMYMDEFLDILAV